MGGLGIRNYKEHHRNGNILGGGKEGKEHGQKHGTLIFFMIIRHSGLRDLWIQIALGGGRGDRGGTDKENEG